jgi:hypothetical protein
METLIQQTPAHDRQPSRRGLDDPSPDPACIQQVLEEVLTSPPFCHTLQCQNLLRYIVKHTLAQEDHLLRERVIGAEVFGRRPDYETGEDPVVRIRAAEVRKRLAQFYQAASESAHPPEVQIEIPSGSYRASFRWREPKASYEPAQPAAGSLALEVVEPLPEALRLSAAAPPPLTSQRATSPWGKSLPALLVGLIVLLALAAVTAYRFTGTAQNRAFNEFWQPWKTSSKPVIIAIGSNAVYRLSTQLTDNYAREHNLETYGAEFFVPIDPNSTVKGSDIQPAGDSFVALGDVAAVSTVVAALTHQQQAFQERFPNDISFAELRSTPTVLVGGFNNPMTIELTKYLPFVLSARKEIDDTRSPGRHWMLNASEDSHHTEDYAIITRLAQKNGDAPILSVAGMGSYGTQAAATFICSPASIAQLAHQLPNDWANHDLQLVLHVSVTDFKPASVDVVAVRTW